MPEGGKGDLEGFDFLPIAVVNMYFFSVQCSSPARINSCIETPTTAQLLKAEAPKVENRGWHDVRNAKRKQKFPGCLTSLSIETTTIN